jgi:anti-sigma regulatory factor (Ser/Thr protein kinase)
VIADRDAAPGGFRHVALLYHDAAGYLAALRGTIHDAHARAEPVLIAVPGSAGHQLRAELGTGAGVEFADLAGFGRNPARITSALLAFATAHTGRRVHCISERVWLARSAAEIREAARNEALTNVALAGTQATIVCPYNAAELPPSVIDGAYRTHPTTASHGAQQQSPAYQGPAFIPPASRRPLPPPPRRVPRLSYDTDLRPVRDYVARRAREGGLDPDRTAELVLSASEVAANTLRHTDQPGTISAWLTRDEFLCQIQDSGQITDPLVGLHPPSPDRLGGQGLWVVNNVCDLVELRTGPRGTTIRLHMWLRSRPEGERQPDGASLLPASTPSG